MVHEYNIITSKSSGTLAAEVQEAIKTDWQPLGPAQCAINKLGGPTWFQTLVKGTGQAGTF